MPGPNGAYRTAPKAGQHRSRIRVTRVVPRRVPSSSERVVSCRAESGSLKGSSCEDGSAAGHVSFKFGK